MWLFIVPLVMFAVCAALSLISRRKKFLSITGKAVLVTGCDSGLGYQIAKHLHVLGFTVICGCLSLTSDGAKSLITKNDLNRLLVIKMDVTDEKSVIEAKIAIESFLKSNDMEEIWAVINNAGVCVFGEFDWYSMDQCKRQIDVNLMGTIRVTKHFLGSVIASKGRIINIGSVNSWCAIPGSTVYSATKCAINGFSDSLRYEVEKFGVNVIVISLGDFSRLTKIMESHTSNVEEMWNHMGSLARNLYGNYFRKYHTHVIEQFGITSAKRFDETSLFEDIEEAVFCKNPRASITCAPLGSRIAFSIFCKLPVTVKHTLFDLLLKHAFKLDARKHVQTFCKQEHSASKNS